MKFGNDGRPLVQMTSGAWLFFVRKLPNKSGHAYTKSNH